ncbi:MAG: inositol monophosphatase [Chloroflexota bacterium]
MLYANDSNSLPTDILQQVSLWIRQAGQIALSHYHNVSPQYKADNSFLTVADTEIQQYLEREIRTAFPDHNFIGEEEQAAEDDFVSSYIWVIDPLDGTTSYALGLPGWGISIGLLYRGKPLLGFFYMPLIDDLTYASPEGHLYWNDKRQQKTICSEWLPKRFLAVNATAHANFQIKIRSTRTLGSIGSSLVYTARGVAAATFAAKARIWDLVACAAIIEAAGGRLAYIDGTSIDYLSLLDGNNTPHPIIAAHPHILAQLPQQIRRIDD